MTGRPLEGRVAVVTGGAQGMGRAHCLELARRGSRVAVLDIDDVAAGAVAAEVVRAGGAGWALTCDVADRASVEGNVGLIAERWGGVDIVVSNAGLVNDESVLADTDDDEWHRMLMVNLGGALNLTRAAAPHLRRSSHGRVIVISSTWGQVPPGHSYSYVAAKGGLIAFAKNLAVELAPSRVTVNCITPGSIRTRMIPDPQRELEQYPIPLGRLAEPEEVAGLVCYLASDEAAFITGQTVSINGGTPIVGI